MSHAPRAAARADVGADSIRRAARRAHESGGRSTRADGIRDLGEPVARDVREQDGVDGCEIGIGTVKPAGFVIFRLSQFSGGEGSAVSE